MIANERAVATGLIGLLLILWLGFLVHIDPRWPGSLPGSLVGIAAAILMQAPLLYLLVKRLKPLRVAVTRRVPMGHLLAWHIYAGILGPILGLIHSGHKFVSPLGIALIVLMLVEVASGFFGRYLFGQILRDRAEKGAMLDQLQAAYRESAASLQNRPDGLDVARLMRWLFVLPFGRSLIRAALGPLPSAPGPLRALALSEAIADMESSIAADEFFRSLFSRWLRIHIAMACLLYSLLALHVWSSVYFGLRWLG